MAMKKCFHVFLFAVGSVILLRVQYTARLDFPDTVITRSPISNSTGENDSPKRTRKSQFVYLVQGASRRPIPGLKATPNREIIWLTYRDKTGDIYFPNSTHATGRNRLLWEAIERAAKRNDGGYLYYLFLDDDLLLTNEENKKRWWRRKLPRNPYDRFEMFLLDFQPAVGFPRYSFNIHDAPAPVGVKYNFDAIFNGFHRHTISFLLPYISDLDHTSWFFAQWFVIHISAVFYNSNRVLCNAVYANNARHHSINMLKGAYTDSEDFRISRDYFRTWINKNNTVETAKGGKINLLQTFKGQAMYTDIPGKARRKQSMEYRVSTKFITTAFNTSHPGIQKILHWRSLPKVKNILYGSEKDEPDFFPDVFPLH
ncbi:uncharacterized protein LOC106170129 [Lingula anatina]|uniref:Uncharacterized protein LOC106170129 n=1 Tax=Lingula anatina TaxID=7574 RepID=A0A1S3J4W8_LINAN|nr:uncharacterized protein LOC106170129 [Lingula anatina]XP_013405328.1 uncharacterized protein LOC106170129 [Lingula anatina]|eukprot:XP_013405327.1 uncharacterized protein LOC106170129 [Lingula anatina]